MRTTRITGLTLNGPKTYSVTGCTCSWTLGSIPSATIGIATGRKFRTGEVESFGISQDDRETKWTLTLNTSIGSFSLLTGYIVSITRVSASNPSGSRTNAQVVLVSSAFMLTTFRMGNYHYWSNISSGASPAMRDASGASTLPLTDVNRKVMGELNEGDADVLLRNLPDTILRLTGLMYGDLARKEPGESTKAIREHFDTSNKAGLRPDIDSICTGAVDTVLMSLEDWIMDSLAGSNVFQSFQDTGGNLLLTMVPRNDKMMLRPLLPWKKSSDYSIDGASCIEMQGQSNMSSLINSTQAVWVEHTTATETNALADRTSPFKFGSLYPSEEGSTYFGPILTINMPSWLHSMAAFTYTGTKSKDPDRRLDYDASRFKAMQDSIKNLPEIGMAVAKTYFANNANSDTRLRLKVPISLLSFKDNLGYIIKVSNIEVAPEGGKQTVYGMLNEVSLETRITPDSGVFNVYVGLSNVRSDSLNEAYGIEEHPIFSESPESSDSGSSGIGEGIGSLGSASLGGGIGSLGGLGSL